MTVLDNALTNFVIDILGLSEVRRLGEAIKRKKTGDIFSYIGETRGQKGVGFIIKKHLQSNIQEIVGISERITLLSLYINETTYTIIQVYAPTEASTKEELEDFYTLLEETIRKHKANKMIIMGDFNSKVGHREHNDEEPMGPYGYGTRNKRGDRLIQFAQGQRLKIINTFFKKNPNSRWTWIAPNRQTKNEIDFILTDRIQDVTDIQVMNGLKYDTDHRLVRMKMKTKKSRQYLHKKQPSIPENIDHSQYQTELEKNLQETEWPNIRDVQHLYKAIETSIVQAASKSSVKVHNQDNDNKLSANTRLMIEQREVLKQRRDINQELKTK